MEKPEDWEQELLLFATDLFSDLLSRHPLFQQFPPIERNRSSTSRFSETIGKCVLYTWHTLRKNLEPTLKWDFPKFAKSPKAFKGYFLSLCDTVRDCDCNILIQMIGISAVLLELISYLHRRHVTLFLNTAPHYWLFGFKTLEYDNFYKEYGWETLELLCEERAKTYDNNIEEIFHDFWWPTPGKSEEDITGSEIVATLETDSEEYSTDAFVVGSPPSLGKEEFNSYLVKQNEDGACSNVNESVKVNQSKNDIVQEVSAIPNPQNIPELKAVTPKERSKTIGQSDSKVAPLLPAQTTTPKSSVQTPKNKSGANNFRSTVSAERKRKEYPIASKNATATAKNTVEDYSKTKNQRRMSLPKNLSSGTSKRDEFSKSAKRDDMTNQIQSSKVTFRHGQKGLPLPAAKADAKKSKQPTTVSDKSTAPKVVPGSSSRDKTAKMKELTEKQKNTGNTKSAEIRKEDSRPLEAGLPKKSSTAVQSRVIKKDNKDPKNRTPRWQ